MGRKKPITDKIVKTGKKRENHRHKRVKNLRCLRQIDNQLAYGYPLQAVAQYVHQQGELSDLSLKAVTMALSRYREDSVKDVDIVSARFPHVVVKAKKQYTDKLEDLVRLDIQYEALLYRFDMAHARERETGVIDPQVDKMHKSILDTISRMHTIKMDLGIGGHDSVGVLNVPAERLVELQEKYGDRVARAMSNPVSRARVLHAMDMIRKTAVAKLGDVIDVEYSEVSDDNNTK